MLNAESSNNSKALRKSAHDAGTSSHSRNDEANRTSGSAEGRPGKTRLGEIVLIAIVIVYASSLILGPLLAIIWGALAEGFKVAMNELSSPEAVSSLKLTLIMAASATVINTVFGVCIAWVLVRDNFWGRRILNG